MPDASTIMIYLFFGLVGTAYIIYGKKRQAFIPLLSGIALCVIPYAITSLTPLVLVSIVLVAIPFIIKG